MTTATITVTLADGGKPVTHTAEYFQVEDGFMILKNLPGKFVAATLSGGSRAS